MAGHIQGKPGQDWESIEQEKNVWPLSKLLHMIKQYTGDILESMHTTVIAGGFQNKSPGWWKFLGTKI